MTTIREAILKAARHIETHPGEFNFNSRVIPQEPHCGTPGCAIGWIQTFFGDFVLLPKENGQTFDGHPRGAMQVSEGDFYCRMNDVGNCTNWINDSELCAHALRLYADKYHPANPVQQPPNWSAMAASQTVPADAVDEMAGTFTLAELVAIDKQRVANGR